MKGSGASIQNSVLAPHAQGRMPQMDHTVPNTGVLHTRRRYTKISNKTFSGITLIVF